MITKKEYLSNQIKNYKAFQQNKVIPLGRLKELIRQWTFDYEMELMYPPNNRGKE